MRISVVQVPYDSGAFGEGMGRGPIQLVEQGLLDDIRDAGFGVRLVEVRHDQTMPELGSLPVAQAQIAAAVRESDFAIVLSGNCGVAAFGATAALGSASTGVIWFDAHGDFNTPETSPSGFFDGMSLSVLVGDCHQELAGKFESFAPVPADHVLLIGAHDLDQAEFTRLRDSRIVHLTVEQMRKEGVGSSLASRLREMSKHLDRFYLHLDLDVLDSSVARINRFAAPGGLTLEELLEAVELLVRQAPIGAIALTAYDPLEDEDGRGATAARAVLRRALAAVADWAGA